MTERSTDVDGESSRDALTERVASLEQEVERLQGGNDARSVTRRGVLGALGIGGVAAMASGGATAATSSDLADDEKLTFGTDGDFSLRYDSTADAWALRDESAGSDEWLQPAGGGANRLSSPLGTSDVPVPGKSFLQELQTDRFNSVRVAHDADDIQRHIDELDGTTTGTNEPGGGVVLLKRKYYEPDSTIILRKGVFLVGLQRGFHPSRDNYEWVYSAITGNNIAEGNPIIETYDDETIDDELLGSNGTPSTNGIHSGLINVLVTGLERNVHGVKANRGGSYLFDGLQVIRCLGNGVWTRGAMNSTIRNCLIQAGTAAENTAAVNLQSEDDNVGTGSADTQIDIIHCRIGSAGVGLIQDSALAKVWPFTKISVHNDNGATGIAAVENTGRGSGLTIVGANIVGEGFSDRSEQEGIHGIINRGNLSVSHSKIHKYDVGILQEGTTDTSVQSTRISGNLSHGILIEDGNWLPKMADVTINGNGGDGIRIDGGRSVAPVSNLVLSSNAGYGLNIVNIRNDDDVLIHGLTIWDNNDGHFNGASNVVARGVYGNRNHNTGTESFTTASTTYSFAHGMDETPVAFSLAPKTPGASGDWSWSADSANITILYEALPKATPIEFSWRAWGESAAR